MKKSILIPFLFMGLLAFASCKGTSENKSTTATDTVQAEKPPIGHHSPDPCGISEKDSRLRKPFQRVEVSG